MHPIAVVELLWRSCCASDSEKQQNSLAARLKIRQRTQLLVDHSLLLGSSREGIHLHDVVLQYLRKRLSAEELRAEHEKVVETMMVTAAERMRTTGRGLQDTGQSDLPFDGEEVDWYCCVNGSYHMKNTLGALVPAQSEDMRRWVLSEDDVLCHQASITIGKEGLKRLSADYADKGEHFKASKATFALAGLMFGDATGVLPLLRQASALLEQINASQRTRESYQLQWSILGKYSWLASISDSSGEEISRIKAQQEELGRNPQVRRDPNALYLMVSARRPYFACLV